MSDYLRSHGLQPTGLPCPSPCPWVCSNSCPLSQWYYLTISFSAALFSFCLQSFPVSESFPMNQLFASGGQSIGVSASVLSMNSQAWFPLGLTGWISLQSRRLKSLLQHHSSKASILWHSSFFMLQLSHPYMTTGKTIPFTTGTFVGKVIPLLFNMLSIFVIAFLPRSKRLLISWLQSPSIVILEPKEIKSIATSTFSPSIFHEAVEPDAMILVFWLLSFKPAFSLFSFTLIRKLFSFSSLSVISHIICISEVVDISPDNSDSILWFIQANILLDVLCI